MEFVGTLELGDSMIIGIFRTLDSGGFLTIGFVGTIESGDGL